MLHVRLAQNALENLIRDTIVRALKRRLPTVASVAELRAVATRGSSSSVRTDDDLITIVTGLGAISSWRWSQTSTATDNGTSIIKPNDVAANGRWLAWSTAIRFAPVVHGDSYTLDQLPYRTDALQPLQAVIVLDKDMTTEELLNLVFGQTPAVVIAAEGDTPDELTQDSGHRWSEEFRFTISVISENLRDRREDAQGSAVAVDPFPGANTIDGMIWELLSGTGDGRLTEEIDSIRDVRPGKAENWNSDLAERLVIRSREWTILATLENPQAPNETGAADEIAAQAEMTDLGTQTELDLDNLVTGGLSIALSVGLVKPVAAGTALIDGVEVTYAGELHTYGASVDTYRDLNAAGTMIFTETTVDGPPPDLAAGALRIAVTTTDGSGIVDDRWIATRKIPYMNPMEQSLT